MDKLPDGLRQPLVELLLSLADDKFILGHRNADWTGLAPILEEDIAFSALAQDDLAHASALYELVATLTEGNADAIAFGRRPEEYRCAAIVTLSDEFDWAVAIVRQFLCDHFDYLRLSRMSASQFKPLADLAAKMQAEEALSLGHADDWVVRLGQASGDAPARMRAAVERVTPHLYDLFEPTVGLAELEANGIYPAQPGGMEAAWREIVSNVLDAARLPPNLTLHARAGGRSGIHPPGFSAVLDELAEVYRVEPDARW